MVQLATAPTERDAASAWQTRSRQFEEILARYRPSFKTGSLPGKGTVHRVLVGPFATEKQAAEFCESLKAAAMQKGAPEDARNGCLLTRN